jgi:2-keto-4-pentenoate hydratase/2-oxohepta-3-ene-1,7-dioic acid hydratase in catechol pathway
MRFARFRTADGTETWGAVEGDAVVDVIATAAATGTSAPSGIRAMLAAGTSGDVSALVAGARAAGTAVTHQLAGVQLLAPIPDPGKVLAVGRNYHDHVGEADLKLPARPKIFTKFASNIIGPDDEIVRPTMTKNLDYEVELAVVIGRHARNVPTSEAMSYVFGYTVMNDVSARDVQFTDEQLTLGKNFSTFCPMGPLVTTLDEMPDPAAIDVWTKVNGEYRQRSSTKYLIFPIPYMVAFLSYVMDLLPGDVIMTGTPAGVGCFMDPPHWLVPGDVVETGAEGVGALRNTVVQGTGVEPTP